MFKQLKLITPLLLMVLIFNGCLEDDGESVKEVESTVTTNSGFIIGEGDLLILNGNESKGEVEIYKFFGSNGAVFCESDRQSCEISGLELGEHKIYLTVEGADGVSDTSDITITVTDGKIPEDSLEDQVTEFDDEFPVTEDPDSDVGEQDYKIDDEVTRFLNIKREFKKVGDTVQDLHSGLIWEDGDELFYGTFREAEAHCSQLRLDGISDWRVPTLKELFYLIDREEFYTAINSEFENRIDSAFWTSQEFNGNEYTEAETYYDRWVINFEKGYDSYYSDYDELFTRCVSGEEGFYDLELEVDGRTVIDDRNYVMWTDPIALEEGLTLEEASDYCESLKFEGYQDWRLPTVDELYSITDHTHEDTPFVYDEFYDVSLSWYWTVSEYYYPEFYVVDFIVGDLYWEEAQELNSAICIRNLEE